MTDEPLVTFYESNTEINGMPGATAVWEIDGVDHRDVIKNRVFLREFAEEIFFHETFGTYCFKMGIIIVNFVIQSFLV